MPLRMGVGVNSGYCLVGNLGSDMHFNYSVLGDPVNVASRLEGLTKTYGLPVAVGESTYLSARDEAGRDVLAFVEIDLIRVKGKQEPERVFALLGDAQVAKTAEFKELKEALDALLQAFRQQRWDEVRRRAESCRKRLHGFPLEGLLALYEERARELVAEPPGEDWDGVTEAKSK